MELIRGIVGSESFQLMASAALNMASALIKMADAIKPLLPLLAGLMAFKVAKGFGGFMGGMMGGMKGGGMRFNRGGLVPGSGNTDTVPALLTPGEFVIRKSSVGAIGAENLAGMNRYAAGGKVRVGRGAYGPK